LYRDLSWVQEWFRVVEVLRDRGSEWGRGEEGFCKKAGLIFTAVHLSYSPFFVFCTQSRDVGAPPISYQFLDIFVGQPNTV
jgi:hypothetical protein